MRVSKWVDFGQEVDVDVTAEDIAGALQEAFTEAAGDPIGEGPSNREVVRALNAVGQFLEGFKDEHIALLTPAQRKILGVYLDRASRRFCA